MPTKLKKHAGHANGNGHKPKGGRGRFRHLVEPAAFEDILSWAGLTQKSFEELRARVDPGHSKRPAVSPYYRVISKRSIPARPRLKRASQAK